MLIFPNILYTVITNALLMTGAGTEDEKVNPDC